MSRLFGRTERRVVVAILITAFIPLVAALALGVRTITNISATAFQPEFGEAIDRSLGVYTDLVASIKLGMRYEADAIAAGIPASDAADEARLGARVAGLFEAHPRLVSLRVEGEDGRVFAQKERAAPIDPKLERELTIRRPLGDPDAGRLLVATFVTPRARLDEQEATADFAKAYHTIERDHRGDYIDATYIRAFVVLLVLTIALAIGAGVLVARPVTRGIARLGAAMQPVAAGDLSVRVEAVGDDEVADLGRAFNRMLEELEQSRARIDFLRRMGEWQKMARRLAHEIKNPLTPIQLAVEESHRRYQGDDPAYRKIIETTLEVVTEEIASLRRLVSEFSSFARLPRAELGPADLGEFLREQRESFALRDEGAAEVDVAFEIGAAPMPAALDREMMHRVLTNIVRNAAQAVRDARGAGAKGKVVIRAATEGDEHVLTIDDDGPGIPADARAAVFDPYVTTKRDGTGLGLSIVKKIVVDHGGRIDATDSPLGGARFVVHLPRAGSAASLAASESGPVSERPPASSGRGATAGGPAP